MLEPSKEMRLEAARAGHLERRFSLPMERILLSERVGYDALFTAEGFGSEGFVPLGYVAGHTRHLKLGTRIAQVTGRVVLDNGAFLQMSAFLIVVDVAVFWLAKVAFQRENILVRWR